MVCLLHGYYDAHTKMQFSLSPPPYKASASSDLTSSAHDECVNDWNLANNLNNNSCQTKRLSGRNMQQVQDQQKHGDIKNGNVNSEAVNEEVSDYVQWLHAMKLVARLPGGVPSEFRRKLWLSLAEKYLKSKNIDWSKEEEKCFCEEWREDDEELGVQIVKDLHRTGSTLCTGPAGDINQAKLKRVLLGYARFNPEVGYCQGFNMLGALILEVMDKMESESIKVMIYLVEGVLPAGYFCGSMGGLQADMAAFRELMQTKLPRLAKHLQKLQGPIENAFEPPLTNVFTMQWFLTMFCTCLPMISVLRVWDLVLIEGSEVILRTALVLWSLLEERILKARSADEFYGKMASFSSELLEGHLTNSNGLIERIVDLGPIVNIQKLRDKHRYNITPLNHGQGLQIYYDDDETEIDDESRLAVATFWGLPWPRRASTTSSFILKHTSENKDRIALDISLLKRKYDRLRERQKQAHVIFTTACSTARHINTMPSIPVNQLLLGQTALVTNKGRRSGPRIGSIPPLRKPSLPAVLQTKQRKSPEKQLKRGETLYWKETNFSRSRHDSLTWKEIKAERAALFNSGSVDDLQSQKLRARPLGKSDSSSYSEDSDKEGNYSSTDTSLCDDEESSKLTEVKRRALSTKPKANLTEIPNTEHERPKSWAPSSDEIPFVLMATDSPTHSGDEILSNSTSKRKNFTETVEESAESDDIQNNFSDNIQYTKIEHSHVADDNRSIGGSNANMKKNSLANEIGDENGPAVNSDKTDNNTVVKYDSCDKGVINQYFEYINDVERPSRLDLRYSFNDDVEGISYKDFAADSRKCQASVHYDHISSKFQSISQITKDSNEVEKHTKVLKQSHSYSNKTVKDTKLSRMDDKNSLSLNSESSKLNKLRYKRKDTRRFTITRSFTINRENEEKTPVKRLSMPANHDFSKYGNSIYSIEEAFPNSIQTDIVNPRHAEAIEQKDIYKQQNYPKAITDISRKSSIYSSITERQQTLSTSPTKSETTKISKNSKDSSEDGTINRRNSKDKDNNKEKRNNTDNIHKSGGTKVTNGHNNLPQNTSAKEKQTERFRRIPSTAELEDRFNALEMQTENVPALIKTKKPPDDSKDNSKDVKQITKSEDRNISKTVKDKKPHDSKKPSDTNTSQRKNNLITKEDSKIHNKPQNASPKQLSKKVPPTTEELEKRFLALEKRMSTVGPEDVQESNINNTEHEAPISAEEQENKDIKTVQEHQQENEKCHLENENSSTEKLNQQVPDSKEEVRLSSETQSSPVAELDKKRMSKAKAIPQDAAQNQSKSTIEDVEDDAKEELTGKPKRPTENIQTELDSSSPFEEEGPEEMKPNKQVEKNFKSDTKSKSAAVHSTQPQTISKDDKTENVNVDDKKSIKFQQKIMKRDSQSLARRSSTPAVSIYANSNVDTYKRRMSHKLTDMEFLMESHEVLKHVEDIVKNVSEEYKSINERMMIDEIDHGDETDTKKEENTKRSLLPEESITPKTEDKNLRHQEIPKPPPNTLPIETKPLVKNPHQRALIEELHQKVNGLVGNNNLKPSIINPKRHTTKKIPLENNSTHAFYRMKNYETSSAYQKSVRRFSDLPSRADLENRLEYLEQCLNSNLRQQKQDAKNVNLKKEVASTSNVQSINSDLEIRVRALEKQLSENSLQVLQAIQTATAINANINNEIATSTNAIGMTDKELVKYAYPEDMDEAKTSKPINISINIKMVLNKDVCDVEHLEHIERIPNALDNGKLTPSPERSDSKDKHSVQIHAHESVVESADHASNGKEVEQLQVQKTVNEPEETASTSPTEIQAENETLPIEVTPTNDNDKEDIKDEDCTREEEIKCQEELGKYEILESSEQEDIKPLEQTTQTDTTHTQPENLPEPTPTPIVDTNKEENKKNLEKTNIIQVKNTNDNENTLVLLMNDESKAMKVRRLTRANTQELEGLFQALESQLIERNLIKSENGKLLHADKLDQNVEVETVPTEEAKAISELSKEIVEFTKNQELNDTKQTEATQKKEEDFDWGSDPVKHHLKRRTVHLPSTKELEARFRSLERQIKLLEDVEKIDVEQRLNEIERKIKLQYSLSHETDIQKYLELCEGKYSDEDVIGGDQGKVSTLSTSKKFTKEQISQTSFSDIDIPTSNDLNYRYRALNLQHSKSKENLSERKPKMKKMAEKQPIHPLEMLLDTSPDSDILPTTGELEHRFHNLEINNKDSSHARTSSQYLPQERLRSQSPVSYRSKTCDDPLKSPTKRKLPTAADLEARLVALEEKRTFLQKDFTEFNQNLMDVVSPSILQEDINLEGSSMLRQHNQIYPARETSNYASSDDVLLQSSSHHTPHKSSSVRFKHTNSDHIQRRTATETMVSKSSDVLHIIKENSKMLDRILKKTLADSKSSKFADSIMTASPTGSVSFSSIHLRRETSPLQRSGTHTGIPLRTSENIGERLSSIKTSIKHIDTLCEEKLYNKEKCLQYIDSVCSNSTHFMSKQNSMDNLHPTPTDRSSSRSERGEPNQSIQITDYDKSFTRSMGSIEGVTRSSPLRSPIEPQYRSSRDLREHISSKPYSANVIDNLHCRVRCDNALQSYILDNHNALNHNSHSLNIFHKVDTNRNGDTKLRAISNLNDSVIYPQKTSNFTYTPDIIIGNSFMEVNTDCTTTTPPTTHKQEHNSRSNTPTYAPTKLDIRHTTVTSTFYDRLLTEKQLEKTLSRTPSRSPILSPSNISNKSSLDVSFSKPSTSSIQSPRTELRKFSPTSISQKSDPNNKNNKLYPEKSFTSIYQPTLLTQIKLPK